MEKQLWQILETKEDLEAALNQSEAQLVVIFKHSTRCPVSSMALRMFERDWSEELSGIQPYFLDLIRYRELSNQIASELEVYHESPQLIAIKDRKAVYNASHNQISAQSLNIFVK